MGEEVAVVDWALEEVVVDRAGEDVVVVSPAEKHPFFHNTW